MGGDRLSVSFYGLDPTLWQALRHLWPATFLHWRHGDLPHRFGLIRYQSGYDAVDYLPRHSGPGSRRSDASRHCDHRRYLPASRAWEMDGTYHGGLRPGNHHRTTHRWINHRQLGLALGLLRQYARRRYRHRDRWLCDA